MLLLLLCGGVALGCSWRVLPSVLRVLDTSRSSKARGGEEAERGVGKTLTEAGQADTPLSNDHADGACPEDQHRISNDHCYTAPHISEGIIPARAAAPDDVPETGSMRFGSLVRLHSLQKSAHLNGKMAVVMGTATQDSGGRYSLKLLDSDRGLRALPDNIAPTAFSDVWASKCRSRSKAFTLLNGDCAPCPEEAPRYYRVPVIGCVGGQFTRLRGKRKIESWLEDDIDEIMHLINLHADLWAEEISTFRDELAGVLHDLFPDCEVVEAGSSSRGTSLFPLSDIDMVCLLHEDSATLSSMLPGLKRKFRSALDEKHPTWKINSQNAIAIPVFKPILAKDHVLFGARMFADVLFGCPENQRTRGIHSASHAKARRQALEGLPPDLCDVSKLLKVVLKAQCWPSKSSKPPSYMVDVMLKFLWEGGPPRTCTECGAMMLRSHCLHHVQGLKCALCEEPLGLDGWVCARRSFCRDQAPDADYSQEELAQQDAHLSHQSCCRTGLCNDPECRQLQHEGQKNIRIPFLFRPTREQHAAAPKKFGMMWNNIHWSYEREYPSGEPTPFGMLQWVIYFFEFCAHFERIAISADGARVAAGVQLPYIQDPGCLANNVVERFEYLPFLKFCWELVDESGDGFISIDEYLEPRRKFFSPFASVFPLGSKVAVNMYLPQYEDIFVIFVDPRWSFYALFNAFGCHGDRKERCGCVMGSHACPNVVMHCPSIASILLLGADGGGSSGAVLLTANEFHLPMITYRVSFGTYMYVGEGLQIEPDSPDERKEHDYAASDTEEVSGAAAEDLRQPRFCWHSSSSHPRILFDLVTGAECYFHPSLNACRAFGPDFYY